MGNTEYRHTMNTLAVGNLKREHFEILQSIAEAILSYNMIIRFSTTYLREAKEIMTVTLLCFLMASAMLLYTGTLISS